MSRPVLFSAFVEIEGGELLRLATYPTRAQAEQAVQCFKQHWPGTYRISEISYPKEAVTHCFQS